ncbi:MAG TPA: ATP-binding cassette domain-containing protein, partial [Actinomycetaceae bacterium]|nr:ATP-binding cassette domain-containing protein [Actinomycetaceae bacterium]
IGHGGVGLSVGQRQRLALARAFVSDAPLVILDEPTAHLDATTEAEVTRAVRALRADGHTVVVIAHRPGVLSAADQIVIVNSEATRTIQATQTARPAGSEEVSL